MKETTPPEVNDHDARTAMESSTGFQHVGEHVQDAHATLQIRRGAYLPHWTRECAIYTVTFRLADSLPQPILQAWFDERENIVKTARQLERPLSIHEEKRLRELHSEKVEAYLDTGYGACWMKDDRIAAIAAMALTHFDGERYDLLAWCVMPNHVHVVVKPFGGHDLPAILHSWKSYTANQANKLLGRHGSFWRDESYDHLIRDEQDFAHSVEYVLNNPDKAGLKKWKWVGSATGFQPVEKHGQDAHATGGATGFQPVEEHWQDAHAT